MTANVLRVAVASTDGSRVDQHLGRADCFYIFEASPAGSTLVGQRRPEPGGAPTRALARQVASRLRPALITITGLCRAAARAADMKRRALVTASICSKIARTLPSLARKSIRSAASTSR